MYCVFVNRIPGSVVMVADKLLIGSGELMKHTVDYLMGEYLPNQSMFSLDDYLTNDEEFAPLMYIAKELEADVAGLEGMVAKFQKPSERPGRDVPLDGYYRELFYDVLRSVMAAIPGVLEAIGPEHENINWKCVCVGNHFVLEYDTLNVTLPHDHDVIDETIKVLSQLEYISKD